MLVSAPPAVAQTVTAMWDPSPQSDQVTGYQVCIGTSSLSCNVGVVSVGPSATSHTFTPAAGVRHYVAIRANNAAGLSAFSSEVSFSTPSFTPVANQSNVVGRSITPLNLSIADPDGSSVTITHTGLPLGLSINSATRQITGTPSAAGFYTVTLFVNDGLVTVSRSFTWAITTAPVADTMAPTLTITSGQLATTSNFTITGTATDSGKGGSGIASVTVNGQTATGGSASGNNVANWSRTLTLVNGANTVTVIATDGANNVSLQQMTVTLRGGTAAVGDFDGDGRSDLWRYTMANSVGTWRIRSSSTSGYANYYWGTTGDIIVPADYDGDGRIDVAAYRPSDGRWWILRSSTNFTSAVSYLWGTSTDIPVPGDYDGDGRADVAIYRRSLGQWWILKSSTNYTTSVVYWWGQTTDKPLPGDYDGDGRTDVAVYRPSTGEWWILKSSTNYVNAVGYAWGTVGDVPVPGDYDGDGRTDVVVYRPSDGQWWILKSSTNFATAVAYQWGLAGDTPEPADYDGDGRFDIAVWRASVGRWYILTSSSNFTAWTWYIWS
jgi:hypothetical protein